jgi:hypothetical protein
MQFFDPIWRLLVKHEQAEIDESGAPFDGRITAMNHIKSF